MSANAAEAAASLSIISSSANSTRWQIGVDFLTVWIVPHFHMFIVTSVSRVYNHAGRMNATVTLPGSVTPHLPTSHDVKHACV